MPKVVGERVRVVAADIYVVVNETDETDVRIILLPVSPCFIEEVCFGAAKSGKAK